MDVRMYYGHSLTRKMHYLVHHNNIEYISQYTQKHQQQTSDNSINYFYLGLACQAIVLVQHP